MRKQTKSLSLNEFNAWLAGVEELHPVGWSPDKEQWKRIRNKISQISLSPSEQEMAVRQYRPNSNTNPFEAIAELTWPTPPSPFDGATIVDDPSELEVRPSRGEEIAAAKRKRTQAPVQVKPEQPVAPVVGKTTRQAPRQPKAAVPTASTDAGVISVKPTPGEGPYSSSFV